MRRGLASLIIGLSLIVASASWAGFILSHTVLDPSRSERLADQLLENPDVRQVLVARLADELETQVPSEVPVSRQLLEAGAERALDDPRIDALIRDGFVKVHQNALAGTSEPVVVDAGALGPVGREALIQARPELEQFIPQSPTLQLELPTAGLSWVGSVKRFVDRFTALAAIVAAVGAVTAFVVARDRAPVLRRVAFWGYAASAFWIAVGYGIPLVADSLSPTSAAIATAAADVFFGAMIRPAVAMAVFATVLLVAGVMLPFLERRRGPGILQPRRRPVTAPEPMAPAGAVAPMSVAPATVARPVDNTDRMPRPIAPATAEPLVDHRVVGGGSPYWGREVGIDISFAEPAASGDGANAERRSDTDGPHWEPGVGYTDDPRPDTWSADTEAANTRSTSPRRTDSGPSGEAGTTSRRADPGSTGRFRP